MRELLKGRANIVKGGLSGGAFGAVFLWLTLAVERGLNGSDAWSVLKLAGAPLLGERALRPGPDATAMVVGIGSHLAISLLWGLAFAALFHGLPKISTLVAGIVWGIPVWLVMAHVVLPLVGWAALLEGQRVGVVLGNHLLFGFGVGLGFLPFQRPRVQVIVDSNESSYPQFKPR